MATIPLTPLPVDLTSSVFVAITHWPFADAFVRELLVEDVPQRLLYRGGQMWAYVDADKTIVAFGTLDVSTEYGELTDGNPYAYIPLLAVHPGHGRKGHGRSVLSHLTDEAACVVRASAGVLHPAVLLDVYESSVAAIGLYETSGFRTVDTGPLVDPLNQEPFRIMTKRVL